MIEHKIFDDQSRNIVAQLVRTLSIDGKPWIITIKRQSERRSLSQNALYWKWVEIAGEHFGYEKDLMDIELKRHCDAPVENYDDIEGNPRQRFTTKTTKEEMSAYMERVSRFLATEHGLMLPHPEDEQRNW